MPVAHRRIPAVAIGALQRNEVAPSAWIIKNFSGTRSFVIFSPLSVRTCYRTAFKHRIGHRLDDVADR
jgi:hypothetical protein